jgi:O-acetylserine/cysteine efflux transporter
MPLRDLLLVLVVCLAWAGNYLASAIALRHFPPLEYTALRLAIVLLLLFPFLRLPPREQWPRMIAVCLCNGALHFAFNFWALRVSGGISSVAIGLQCYIPMTALLAVWWLGERIGWRTAVGIALAFLGVLVLGFDPSVMAAPAALILTLIAALALAIGTTLMRGLRGIDTFSLQAWSALLGIPLLVVWSAFSESGQWELVKTAQWIHWGGAVYSAVAASLIGHGILYVLVQRHPVSQVTPYLLMTPLFAVALGVVFWGDRLGTKLLVGGSLVLSGVLLVALRSWQKHRELGPPTVKA